MSFGFLLLCLDLLMIYRLVVSLNRIILLTADSAWTIVWQHILLLAISFIFLIRALCEDLNRTGSQLSFFVTGYNYDLFVIEAKYQSVIWITDNWITRLNHNIFPFVTAIIIATFKFLSTAQLVISDDAKPAMEVVYEVDKSHKMSINDELLSQKQISPNTKFPHRISKASIQLSISSYQINCRSKPSDN